MSIFREFPVFIPVCTGIVVQAFKLGITLIRHKFRVSWKDITQFGGFPSAHTAFVTSLTYTVYVFEGASSLLFALSFVFSLLFLFDAMRVRYEAGRHAQELNRMLGEKKYIERLGHTPFQVFAGIVFGIAISFFFLSL